jgi:hypothetical protein
MDIVEHIPDKQTPLDRIVLLKTREAFLATSMEAKM